MRSAVTVKPGTTTTTRAKAAKATTAAGMRSAQALRATSVRLSRVPVQQAARNTLGTHFRLPGTPDPAVRLRRLAGVSTWAALLGLGGLLVVVRIMVGLYTTIAGWYLVTTFGLGLVGILCTVGAFGSVHRHGLPWALLGAATAAEAACVALTLV
jgi:hypothetical protein